MILEIHPENPEGRKIDEVVKILDKGGIIIYPTDSVYSMGCSLLKKRSLEKLAWLKGLKLKKANFSIICHDMSHLAEYTKVPDRPTYKILNKNLPGPFTFILPASSQIPKLFESNKKTVGFRIPDHPIILDIVKALGHPIVTTSIHTEDEILEYETDPHQIAEKWENRVDLIIDGGFGQNRASTVVDLTNGVDIIRQGIGELEW